MFAFLESIAAPGLARKLLAATLILGLGGCSNFHHDRTPTRTEGGLEDGLDARLRSTQRQISDLHTYNLGLQYEIARHQQSLVSLQAANHAAGRAVEQFELRNLLATRVGEIERRTRSCQETIDAHKAALRQFSGDPRSAALRTNIKDLSAEQAALHRHRDELRSIVRKAR